MTLSDVIGHVILIGPRFNSAAIDPVIWSMVIEMRISILMPAFILILRRTTKRVDILVLVVVILFGGSDYLRLAIAIPYFIAGTLIAKHRQSILAFVRGLSRLWKLAFLATSAALFASRMLGYDASTAMGYVSGAGATGLILSVLCFPLCEQIASSRVARFLGDVSYSFYLVHLSVLIFLSSWLLPATHSMLACWISSLCAALIVSKAMRSQVELPMQKFGKLVWPVTRAWFGIQFQSAK